MASQGDNHAVATGLREVLADTYKLFGKTQSSHWNVEGPNFVGLHSLFETQYRDMFEAIDELAERLRALGERAPESIPGLLAESRLPDATNDNDGSALARMLAEDHRRLAQSLRRVAETADAAGDAATHDLLVQRSAEHEKAAWMLRSAAA
ncbi:MAG TPA: DNA starvation/stationary phase protection protein [Acetobacteraceae bacterium]|nr:DNA starvation/stationary phase protection protein [Acetobacteraceae bacterium]